MIFLLDTNHTIAHLNGNRQLASRIASHAASGDLFAISSTVLGELYYGAYASQQTSKNIAAIADFLNRVRFFEFEMTGAEEFGRIRAEQRAKGKPIPTADAQIAAIARLNELTLLTNDVHFQSVDRLLFENWLV